MSTKRKDQNVTPLVLQHGPSLKSVKNYYISTNAVESMKFVPECEPIGRGPGLETWRAHSDITSAREQFEITKSQYEEHKKTMDRLWKNLEEHQLMLKFAFERFNEFIRENEEKREWASQKISDDTKTLELRTIEVENKIKENLELTQIANEMEAQLEKYSVFEQYLNSVAKECKEFRCPIDIIHRYEALVTAKYNLSEKQEKDLKTLEGITSDMSRLMEDKKIQIVGFFNRVSNLRIRYDRARNESKKMEVVLNKIKRETSKRQSDLFRVRESLWALYLKICKNKGIAPSCKKQDYEGQLVLVMRGLVEIRKIVKMAEERSAMDDVINKIQIK